MEYTDKQLRDMDLLYSAVMLNTDVNYRTLSDLIDNNVHLSHQTK